MLRRSADLHLLRVRASSVVDQAASGARRDAQTGLHTPREWFAVASRPPRRAVKSGFVTARPGTIRGMRPAHEPEVTSRY
jgi:hypothetical protein